MDDKEGLKYCGCDVGSVIRCVSSKRRQLNRFIKKHKCEPLLVSLSTSNVSYNLLLVGRSFTSSCFKLLIHGVLPRDTSQSHPMKGSLATRCFTSYMMLTFSDSMTQNRRGSDRRKLDET